MEMYGKSALLQEDKAYRVRKWPKYRQCLSCFRVRGGSPPFNAILFRIITLTKLPWLGTYLFMLLVFLFLGEFFVLLAAATYSYRYDL